MTGTLDLNINDRLVHIGKYPSGWDEMPEKIYIKVCSLLSIGDDVNINKLKILRVIFKMQWWFCKPSLRIKSLLTLPAMHLHTILHDKTMLGYIFTPTGPTKMLVPSFKYKRITYYAPPTSLTNVCTEELIAAWYAFSQFAKTQDVKHLDKLIALLYRPLRLRSASDGFDIKYASDIREPLNQLRWDIRVKIIEGMDHGLKIAILKQFSGHWAVFENKYREIFPKKSKGETDGAGLMGLMYEVSGQIFGTMEQTAKTNANEVFYYVSMQIQKNKKLQEKFKNQKK